MHVGSFKVADNTSVTFYIRRNLTFSDQYHSVLLSLFERPSMQSKYQQLKYRRY